MRRRVIVVGAGGAGLAAADQVGGATARAGGVVFAADTAQQKARGIDDSVEELINYYEVIARHELEPRLVRKSATGTREAFTWLEELGITWDPERLYVAGLELRPRGHLPTGDTRGLGPAGGAMIAAALLTAVEATEAQIRTGTRVAALLTDDTGRVTGVRTEAGEELTADAVVLASGGFGAGTQMLREFWPEGSQYDDWHWYLGPDTNVGDGIRMGLAAGGEMVGYGGQLIETPNFGRLNDAFTPPWVIYVNQKGHRFMDETDTYCVKAHLIGRQPHGECWAVFDDAALSKLAEADEYVDPYGLGVDLESNWTHELLSKQIEAGVVLKGDTLADLAHAGGIDVEGLEHTAELWNADVAAGTDSVFGKTGELYPISSGPFYAARIRPAIIGMTFAGIRIDDSARVLSTSGRPIPGLYAAGEVAGGLDTDVYMGGGTSIGNAVVFGRTAGQSAVAGA